MAGSLDPPNSWCNSGQVACLLWALVSSCVQREDLAKEALGLPPALSQVFNVFFLDHTLSPFSLPLPSSGGRAAGLTAEAKARCLSRQEACGISCVQDKARVSTSGNHLAAFAQAGHASGSCGRCLSSYAELLMAPNPRLFTTGPFHRTWDTRNGAGEGVPVPRLL